MVPERRRSRSRRIAGISVRTSNAAEMNPSHAQIPRLWHRFGTEHWPARLEQLGVSGPVHAVYCDYESDVSGPYRLLLGRAVDPAEPPPSDIEVITVPEGEYLVFSCVGPMPAAVLEGWRRIWQFFAETGVPCRAYTADFELYQSDTAPPDIWVAVLQTGS